MRKGEVSDLGRIFVITLFGAFSLALVLVPASGFEKTGRPLMPKGGEEVQEIVNELLSSGPETVVAIKEALQRREDP